MKKLTAKLFAALAVMLVMLTAAMPMAVYASATPDAEEVVGGGGEEATPTITINNLNLIGSNGKYYLPSPELEDKVDAYAFNIPDWMESVTLNIKAVTGLKISGDGIAVEEKSGVYQGKISDITKSSQAYVIEIVKSDITRKITLTIRRSKIDCFFDSVSMYKGDSAISSTGSISEGLTFTLPSGTKDGVTLRIKPRHEEKLTVTNLTGLLPEQITGNETKAPLELGELTKRYDFKPTLVEGTNLFRLEITGGSVVKTCDITIIVGDPNANAPTTTTIATTSSTVASAADAPAATSYTGAVTTATTKKNSVLGGSDGMSPIMWILIGVIITIIIGAIIFMIVNLSGKDDGYDDYEYDDYDTDYRQPRAPRQSSRNLTDYIDDEDYYDDRRSGRDSQYGYDDNDYNTGYGSRAKYRDEYPTSRRRRDDYYDE